MIRALFALVLALPPVPAAYVAAFAVGRPDIAPALVSICQRESRCSAIGPHAGDSDRDPSDGWRGQVRLGHLRPWCQPYRPDVWHTRGAWGLWASAHWEYLPPCYAPELLDVPVVSAWVAARKYLARCEGARRSRWCAGTLRHAQHSRRRVRLHRSRSDHGA